MSGAGAGYTPDRNIDREAVCFTTDDGGDEVFHGTIRHDDSLAGPGTPGWALFDQSQTFVPATEPGLTFVDCDGCCVQVIGEGCWDDGTDSGTYVSIRDAAGDVTLQDPATGDPVDAGDVVACPGPQYRTEVRTVGANDTLVIPGAAVNLVSWSVRARSAGVELNVSGVTTSMDENEIIQSATQDDVGVLEDAPAITTGAGESARVSWLLRTEP